MAAVWSYTLIGREVCMDIDWEYFMGFVFSQIVFWVGFFMGTTYGN